MVVFDCRTFTTGRRTLESGSRLAGLLLLGPLVAGDLGAQQADSTSDLAASVVIAGIVTDQNGRPLIGAEVLAGDGLFTISTGDGRFLLPGVPAGEVNVLVRRVGYRPASLSMEVLPGLRVDLAVSMSPHVVELGAIVVEGKRMDLHLWRNGFYTREERGLGTYFGPEYLALHSGSMTSLLSEVSSVQVDRATFGREIVLGRYAGDWCELDVFLDGAYVRGASSFGGLDRIVDKRDVLGIEVYPRRELIPTSISRTAVSGVCGAIVIWTKRWRQ